MSYLPSPPPYGHGAHCGQCGKGVAPGALACMSCGFSPSASGNFCQRCGNPATPGQVVCLRCGSALRGFGGSPSDKSKIAAGVLAILLGGFGLHKFYLGYTNAAVIMLVGTLGGFCLTFFWIGLLFVWIPSIIGLVEGIIYLTKSEAEFHASYVLNRREWF